MSLVERLRENDPDMPTCDRHEAADALERYEIAHRQLQVTVDRLGAENERLREAIDRIFDAWFGETEEDLDDSITEARKLTNQQGAPEK